MYGINLVALKLSGLGVIHGYNTAFIKMVFTVKFVLCLFPVTLGSKI